MLLNKASLRVLNGQFRNKVKLSKQWLKRNILIIVAILISFLMIALIVTFSFGNSVFNISPARDLDAKTWLVFWGSIFSFIGSLFLGIVVLTQNREANNLSNKLLKLEEERNKPDIIICESQFSLKWKNKADALLAFLWDDNLESDGSSKDNFAISTFNIGNGTAKSVCIKWDFDIYGLVNSIKTLDEEDVFYLDYIINNEKELIALTFGLESEGIRAIEIDLIEKIDYIIPSNIDPTGIMIRLPKVFCVLYSIYSFILETKHNEYRKTYKPPNLKMSLYYLDLSGRQLIKEYILTFYDNKRMMFIKEGCQETETEIPVKIIPHIISSNR